MANIDNKKANPNTDGRISEPYIKDFRAKVEALQARFTGESRRALHDALKSKGVITEDYTPEKWDNDIKAWKKNPNAGIFNHLEMVGAILDEAQMPAFEVFGGPHARDTDEIIKSVSSAVIEHLKPLLEDLKVFKTEKKRTTLRKERIINSNAFENLITVRQLIEEYFTREPKFLIRNKADAFFFLYKWNDLDKNNLLRKPGVRELIHCIKQLAVKIINGLNDFDYTNYFPHFYMIPSEMMTLPFFEDRIKPDESFFTRYGNLLLTIAYQLNAIIPFYDIYRKKRKMSLPKVSGTDIKKYKHKIIIPPDVSPDESIPVNDNGFKEESYFPSFSYEAINDLLDKHHYYVLKAIVIKSKLESGLEDLQKFTENTVSRIFENTVECFSRLTRQYMAIELDRYDEIESPFCKTVLEQLKTIINNLQKIAEFLLDPISGEKCQQPISSSYYIDEKKKRIIQKEKRSAVLQINPTWWDIMNENISLLENTMNTIEKLPRHGIPSVQQRPNQPTLSTENTDEYQLSDIDLSALNELGNLLS
jgi:hypothetical protein